MSISVVSRADPDYPEPKTRHLWLLVGGRDYSHGGLALYLGGDCDIDGEPIAEHRIEDAIIEARDKGVSLDTDEIRQALSDYRIDRDNNLY